MSTHWRHWGLILLWFMLSGASAKAQAHPVIVGIFNIYPLAYPDEKGEWVGFSVDLLAAIARTTGIRYDYEVTTFVNLIPGVATRLYDVGTGCTAITAARRTLVDFTDPIFVYRYVLVVPKAENSIASAADLTADRTVVALRGAIHENLARTRTQAQVLLVDAVADGFADVVNGEAHASIALDISLDEYFQTHPDAPLKIVGEPLQSLDCALIVNKGQLPLLLKLNEGLARAQADGTYDRLYRQWFGKEPPAAQAPSGNPPAATTQPTTTLLVGVPTQAMTQTAVLTRQLAGLYYLSFATEPATYQIATLTSDGLWVGLETEPPGATATSHSILAHRGVWQISAGNALSATILSFPVAEPGSSIAGATRKLYQMTVDATGSVSGSYTAHNPDPAQTSLAATTAASQTVTINFTGRRVQGAGGR